jgi:hypothetical protein
MVFVTQTDGYQKMCDTNKNVTKMGVIIKGAYYNCSSYRPKGEEHSNPQIPLFFGTSIPL